MGIKLDKTAIIVCSVVGSIGLLSAIFGFSAEGTKLTPYTILVDGDACIYPPNPALGLGICAAIFLLVSQVTISAVSGCCGCCKSRSIPSETKRIVAIVCAVFSWIMAVIAWALLILGAEWNTNVVRVDAPYCPYLKDGIFAGGGVLALAATGLGIASFVMLRTPPVQATAAPATAAGGTPNTTPGMSPNVVIGHPLLPTGKTQDDPVKPYQGYEQAQVPPSTTDPHSHPQQQVYAPQQNLESPPAAAAQGNGYHSDAPNHHHHQHQQQQQQLPPQGLAAAAAAAPVVVSAALAPSVQQPPLGIPIGQVSLPQVHVPTIPIPATQGSLEMPAVPLPNTAQNGSSLQSVIRSEVARQGIKIAAQMVSHSLFSADNATDSTGVVDVIQPTN